MNDENDFDQNPLSDATDSEILMHREVHFGGQFTVMVDYYESDGVGMQQEFSITRMKELEKVEREIEEDLAAHVLSGAEAEKIAHAKQKYEQLRALYEEDNLETKHPRLIADLILSEEEEPKEAMEVLVREGEKVSLLLMKIIRSEDFYDPLFPGYGRAPFFAADCLGEIGDPRAVEVLFEALGKGEFFDEDRMIFALKKMKGPASEFLLHLITSHLISPDNEQAAMVLSTFEKNEEVAKTCVNLLYDQEFRKHPTLFCYLIYCCSGLESSEDRARFQALLEDEDLSQELKEEIQCVMKDWGK